MLAECKTCHHWNVFNWCKKVAPDYEHPTCLHFADDPGIFQGNNEGRWGLTRKPDALDCTKNHFNKTYQCSGPIWKGWMSLYLGSGVRNKPKRRSDANTSTDKYNWNKIHLPVLSQRRHCSNSEIVLGSLWTLWEICHAISYIRMKWIAPRIVGTTSMKTDLWVVFEISVMVIWSKIAVSLNCLHSELHMDCMIQKFWKIGGKSSAFQKIHIIKKCARNIRARI